MRIISDETHTPMRRTMQDDYHDPESTTVPTEVVPERPPYQDLAAARSAASYQRLVWLLIGLSCLLLLRFFVPYFAEQVQYAVTRGRERAELEIATQALGDLPLGELSKAYQYVSKRVGPSVVHINVASTVENGPADEFSSLFGFQRRRAEGQGSGVIVDAAGYLLTNYHVVFGASEIEVSLSDGRRVDATVVGTDELTDLALLKINADKLVAAEWGDSDELDVGAMVWAVGSPFGLQRTITFGILSAKGRAGMYGTPWQDFLQTDAAVNPGNSGGPLVDARGHVVGINTAIVGDSYQGIGFAIPSSIARRVYEKLRADGRVERGWLGVQLADIDEVMANQYGLSSTKGALVVGVVTTDRQPSPAEQAGIQPGDVVVRWEGHEITDRTALSQAVARTEIGSDATIVVIRRGQELTLNVRVGRRQVD